MNEFATDTPVHSRCLYVEGTTARTVERLVPGERLVEAIRGRHDADRPLLRWACRLADLHRELRCDTHGRPCEMCRKRMGLIHEIDTWVELRLPQHRHGCALHTETVGQVIDRIAAAYIRADHLLTTVDPVIDPRVHLAWSRLAELIGGYNDLAQEVARGRRRLPTPDDSAWCHDR